MDIQVRAIKALLGDIRLFTAHAGGLRLRGYQQAVARAVSRSVLERRGETFVVMFPRQSGKNELQAQLQAYLLTLLSEMHAEIVQISPTWKPQSLNAMRRLERVLGSNVLTARRWTKESGYIYRLGVARIYFLSGHPESNIVGQTASTLLSVDEAQEIGMDKFDKEILPMAASTNATIVFWGTAWTSATLLARELRACRRRDVTDGRNATCGVSTVEERHAFVIDAEAVAKEVPAYGEFVAKQVRRLGREHPLVRTQFFSQEIDGQGGMFPPERRARMQGRHAPLAGPRPGAEYALLADVAGADENAEVGIGGLANPGRDLTAVTVVEVDLETLQDPLVRAPGYRVVCRMEWIGTLHTALYGRLRGLIEHWEPRYVVVDATGVGHGLAGFLSAAYPKKVIPFTFTAKSKSDLGWGFLAAIESGRYAEYDLAAGQPELRAAQRPLQERFWSQAGHCQHQVVSGVGRTVRWSVPEGTRDSAGELVHDDLLISAALCSVLDELDWPSGRGGGVIIEREDPLREIDGRRR